MAPARPGQWNGPPPPEKTYMECALPGWRKNPAKLAVIDVKSGEEVTFRQFEKRVRDIAGSLQKIGVRSRTKVQFYADNSLNSLVSMQALLFCSATVFAFKPNKGTKYTAYKFQTDEAEIDFVITDAVNYDIAVHELLADPQCSVRKVIIVSGVPKTPVPKAKVFYLHELPQGEFEPPKDVRIREDCLFVSYTSGSTGQPKGVMHSHYSFVAGLTAVSAPLLHAYKDTDRFLLLNTLTYICGFSCSAGPLAFGCTLILASHDIVPELPIYIEKYKASFMLVLECAMKTLMDNAQRYPNKEMLSSLRVILTCGTTFPELLRKQIQAFFSKALFINIYGMTESLAMVTASSPSPEFVSHVGLLIPNFEVKILNNKSEPVEVGESGELFCRGPQMTLGYWKRKTDDFTADGYYATGDLVSVDSAGNMTIVGRKKDFIICLDDRISPLEIEDLLLKHPAVQEVVVVATPHPIVQEAPTAMVVLKADYDKPETLKQLRQQLVNYVSLQLCDSKHLHGGVHFVKSLDKTESGKYARAAITQQALKLSGS